MIFIDWFCNHNEWISFIDFLKIATRSNCLLLLLLSLPNRSRSLLSNMEGTIHLNARIRWVSAILSDHIGFRGE